MIKVVWLILKPTKSRLPHKVFNYLALPLFNENTHPSIFFYR